MSVKVTIFIILVCVFAFALYMTIVRKLLDCVCKISEKNSEKNTPTKTDDGKQHFYYYTSDGDWIDLCGGDDSEIEEVAEDDTD